MILGPDGKPATGGSSWDAEQQTEIVRSYAFKMNLENYGGNRFESVDLFCSQKTMCRMEDAIDASLALYSFCRSQVLAARREAIENIQTNAAKRDAQQRRSAA